MTDTKKQKPPVGKEYWKSRLHRHGEEPGRHTKLRTHRKERRTARKLEFEEKP